MWSTDAVHMGGNDPRRISSITPTITSGNTNTPMAWSWKALTVQLLSEDAETAIIFSQAPMGR